MNNLRNLRKAKGLSIKKLHELTGIPVRTLEDWDCEKRQLQSYHRIKALSSILDCDMDTLMTKAENCLYGANRAVISLYQNEAGVDIDLYRDIEEDVYKPFYQSTIPRETALELLKAIKVGQDIKDFLDSI